MPSERAEIQEAASLSPSDEQPTAVQSSEEIERARRQSHPQRQPPAHVPGYTIEGCLGEGAYGSVWLAEEQNTGKQVAIKFYSHRRGLDWSLLNREVEKLAVLYTSRNIVGLLEVGWDSDPPYYVMEYLENGSLSSLLSDGPLPVHEAVRIAKSVLAALVHAHGSGILHCDLKPANVLLDTDLEPRLCDFGQSRLPQERNPALGTLFYMAPEQARTDAVPDARWDVYALGALLYHMLSGSPPHRTPENERLVRSGETLEERLAAYRRLLEESPGPPSLRKVPGVDRQLADIVERCLQTDPQKRFPNAQAVLDALELREQYRSRRPLLTLGIIGPGLLLAATAPIVYDAMRSALQSARTNLTARALESDAHAAKILARSLAKELEDRTTVLERIAEEERLKVAIESSAASGWTDREALFHFLEERKSAVDRRRRRQDRELDRSWFLTDAEGYQRWREPFDEKTYDHRYNFRDYFHGLGKEFPEGGVPEGIGPITEPYISLPFRSQATHRYMIAVAVPVWDSTGEEVIGVLARTTHLGQLLADYKRHVADEGTEQVDRVVALVDARDGKLLDHPWMTREMLGDITSLESLTVSSEVVAKLDRLRNGAEGTGRGESDNRDADYRDPVGRYDPEDYGGRWLAAFASIGETGWFTIVQERRAPALRPVEDMRHGLVRYAVSALIVSGGLIVLLLYFVKRSLTDRSLQG